MADEETTHIRVTKETQERLKEIASVLNMTIPEYLAIVVEDEYLGYRGPSTFGYLYIEEKYHKRMARKAKYESALQALQHQE